VILKGVSKSQHKRRALRAQLTSGRLLRYPGVHSPLIGTLIEELGFEGVYVSGSALSCDMGLPAVGLGTLTDISDRAQRIAATTSLPALADTDTGFNDAVSAARIVHTFEDLGFAGCHLDDRRKPAVSGSFDQDAVITSDDMVRRLQAAVAARRDPDFVICARTHARNDEGLDATIDRASAYVDAGADAILPESLFDAREYATFRRCVNVPLLASMNASGRAAQLDARTLANAGVALVIYPFTALQTAMRAVEEGLAALRDEEIPIQPHGSSSTSRWTALLEEDSEAGTEDRLRFRIKS
jgi:methylisocitrate lyase